jgi:predicted branched-subunit amino acid permease
MRPDTVRFLNVIQMISEILIALGYLIGLFPFGYALSGNWVVPLVFVSLIVAFLNRNGTQMFTVANVALALLSWIPVIGFVFRIIGAGVSWINLRMIRKSTHY